MTTGWNMLENVGSSTYFGLSFLALVDGGLVFCFSAWLRKNLMPFPQFTVVRCGAQSKHGFVAQQRDRGSYSPWSEDCDPQLPD
jgi:hypothetical protein